MADYLRRVVARAEGATPAVAPGTPSVMTPRASAPRADAADDPFAAAPIAPPIPAIAPTSITPIVDARGRDTSTPRASIPGAPIDLESPASLAPRAESAPFERDRLAIATPRVEPPAARPSSTPVVAPRTAVETPAPPGEPRADDDAARARVRVADRRDGAKVELEPPVRPTATPAVEPPRRARLDADRGDEEGAARPRLDRDRDRDAARDRESDRERVRLEPGRIAAPPLLTPRPPAPPIATPPAASPPPAPDAGSEPAPRLVIGRVVVEVVPPAPSAAPRVAPRVAAVASPRPFRAGSPVGAAFRRPFGLGQS